MYSSPGVCCHGASHQGSVCRLQISGKRWRIDLNARQDVALQLSSVDLPGGIQVRQMCLVSRQHLASLRYSAIDYMLLVLLQRRRTAEDEVNMRSIFEEGDLISVSAASQHLHCTYIMLSVICAVLMTGHASPVLWAAGNDWVFAVCRRRCKPCMQTAPLPFTPAATSMARCASFLAFPTAPWRLLRHPRLCIALQLRGGQLVTVSPNLVKRQKQHFNDLGNLGVSIILGCNGMIWVAAQTAPHANGHAAEQGGSSETESVITPQQREAVCRVANAVRVLAVLSMLIFPSSIMDVCKARTPASHGPFVPACMGLWTPSADVIL